MVSTFNTSNKSLLLQSEDNDKEKVYQLLLEQPLTCTQIAIALNIPQKCCTRYKRQLEVQNKLAVIKLVRCPITKVDKVQLLTTNETLFHYQNPQLQLWK